MEDPNVAFTTPPTHWPITLDHYDRTLFFCDVERNELSYVAKRTGGAGRSGGTGGRWPERVSKNLNRLLRPIQDVCTVADKNNNDRTALVRRQSTLRAIIVEMSRTDRPYWAWTQDDWIEFLQDSLKGFNARLGWSHSPTSKPCAGTRGRCVLAAYLFGALPDPRVTGEYRRLDFAHIVFGHELIDQSVAEVQSVLKQLGYSPSALKGASSAVPELLILNKSPHLSALTRASIQDAYDHSLPRNFQDIALVSRVLLRMGIIKEAIKTPPSGPKPGHLAEYDTCPPEWKRWCDEWIRQSTLEPRTKTSYYRILVMIGRWLQENHPGIISPDQWTATLAAEAVAALSAWEVGRFSICRKTPEGKFSAPAPTPVRPRTVLNYIGALRTFFIDLQMSERIFLRFNPHLYLCVPRTIRRKILPDPRVIERPVWAKLIWAGQNLDAGDLPSPAYPLEMVRAVAAAWLYTALRSDEIARLVVGAIEWPATELHDRETGSIVAADDVCYLHVPMNKTSGAFRKPVAPYVGRAIEAWQDVRPKQSMKFDRKSGEMVDYLFSMRDKSISKDYINGTLIPMLCRKAGLDMRDHRGTITSHRARATIATFLGNSENPMSLVQLMRWLGHRTVETTRSYVEADATKVAVKIAQGSLLQQNLATIPVLIDNDVIGSGAAARGEPWKYFDLGHGFCKLSEWSTCKHRMACARCDYFEPKDSLRIQLLEANGNLSKMLEFVTLGPEERKLVERGIEVNRELLIRLQHEPTPSGQTPAELIPSGEVIAVTPTVSLIEEE